MTHAARISELLHDTYAGKARFIVWDYPDGVMVNAYSIDCDRIDAALSRKKVRASAKLRPRSLYRRATEQSRRHFAEQNRKARQREL